jgi:DNA-binding NarL/FixJ family response regulator
MPTEVRSISDARRPWPLTGRRGELEDCLGAVAEPDMRAVVISGPAGIGKSRLAAEVRRAVDASGGRTAHVVGSTAAQSVPLAAVAHLLPEGVSNDDLAALVGAAHSLAGRDSDGRLVCIVDDAQLLDPTSVALLDAAVVAGDLFVVATVRSGTAVPGALDALWRSGAVLRVELGELERQSIETLLHRALGGPVAADAASLLWEASRGNALFLRELVIGSIANGTLDFVDGAWRLVGDLAVTEGLRALVMGRHDAVDGAERLVLDAIAIAGPVGLDEVLAVSGLPDLDALERPGLVAITAAGRRVEVDLTHPLHGELLRDAMTTSRARELRRACIARVTAHGARRRGDVLLLAAWSLDADGTADPMVLTRAAHLARQAHDFAGVERLARAALASKRDPDLVQLLAEACYQSGAFVEAEAELAALDLDACTTRQRLLATITRVTNLFWGLRQPEAAFAAGDAALAMVDGDDVAELRAQQASLVGFSGRIDDALALAQLSGDATARARTAAAIARAPVLAMRGETGAALAVAEQGFAEHLALDPMLAIAHPGTHVVATVLALAEAGRLAEARDLAQVGYDEALTQRIPIAEIWFTLLLGRVALTEGRPATAQRWFRDTVARCRSVGHRLPERLGSAGVALAAAYLGAPEAAYAEVDADHDEWFALFGGDVARARAWTLVALGRPVEARAVLTDAARAMDAFANVQQAATVLHDLARLGDDAVVEELDEVASRSDSALVHASSRHARGRATRDAAMLDSAAERFTAMGAQLFAAEAWAAAADAARRDGNGRLVTAYQRRVAELEGTLEGARTPGLVVADAAAPVTPREREIALLAADGVASKEIAEQLFLSVRTVNNHLQKVYTKLGVTSRAELAAALGRESG